MNAMPDFADILAPIQAARSYRDRMAGSLASILADLINENEPLLKAELNGDEITVTERGGGLAFEISVAPLTGQEA